MPEIVKMNCPICEGNVNAKVLLWSHDVCYKLPGKFAVVCCAQCSFVMSYPALTEEQLSEYYPSDYYGETPDVSTPKHKANLLELGQKLYQQLSRGKKVSHAALYHHPSVFDLALPIKQKPQKILDVGAGWGRFLSGAIGMGWQAEGLDFSPEIHRVGASLNIPVYEGSLGAVQDKLQGNYQLISMNHVLEHLDNPLETLKNARDLLEEGGVVRIQIPMWRPVFVRLLGAYWFPLDLPRHRWHFRVKDVRTLAEKAGFNHVMFVPETGTHPLQSSFRIWVRDHPKFKSLARFTSVDNKLVRLILLPLGLFLAVMGSPMEATFYLMADKKE